MVGGGDGKLLLRPETEPFLLDDPRPETGGQRGGIVAAAGVDDDDIVGEARAFQAGGQLPGGIEGDDGN